MLMHLTSSNFWHCATYYEFKSDLFATQSGSIDFLNVDSVDRWRFVSFNHDLHF